jgi:hypothetical protein
MCYGNDSPAAWCWALIYLQRAAARERRPTSDTQIAIAGAQAYRPVSASLSSILCAVGAARRPPPACLPVYLCLAKFAHSADRTAHTIYRTICVYICASLNLHTTPTELHTQFTNYTLNLKEKVRRAKMAQPSFQDAASNRRGALYRPLLSSVATASKSLTIYTRGAVPPCAYLALLK